MSTPLVSCICLTYGRPWYVEEAIESFLRQDYPNKEMVIINDLSCQKLSLIDDMQKVKVINVSKRFPTLGDKRNFAVEQSNGELIAPFDDDDISLPWRLSQAVDALQAQKKQWFRASPIFEMRGDTIMGLIGHGNASAIWRRELFDLVGGYPPMNTGEDTEFGRLVLSHVGLEAILSIALPTEKVSYIYRRKHADSYNLSQWGRDGKGRNMGYERVRVMIDASAESGPILLKPQWRRDYVAETRKFIGA